MSAAAQRHTDRVTADRALASIGVLVPVLVYMYREGCRRGGTPVEDVRVANPRDKDGARAARVNSCLRLHFLFLIFCNRHGHN